MNGYTTDRFARRHAGDGADGLLGAGQRHRYAPDGRRQEHVCSIKFDKPSFPGSIAVVKEQPAKVQSEGVTTPLYFRGAEAEMAQPYGQEIGKIMSLFHGHVTASRRTRIWRWWRPRPARRTAMPRPGMIFLAPARHRQGSRTAGCWRTRCRGSGGRRWSRRPRAIICGSTNGLATYSEMLWTEHTAGAGAHGDALATRWSESLTMDNVPMHAVGAPGGLLARTVGADRQQGRGGDEHAALRDGRREVLRDR